MKKTKRDIKKQPFAWQEKHILRLLQKTFKGNELSRYLLLYNALTWIHSDFNGEPVKYFTKTISKYSGLSPRFIPHGIKTFQDFGIVKLTGLKEDHTFITKVLSFTPENVPENTEKLTIVETNNSKKSTIAENAELIEHSTKKKVSKDTSTTLKKVVKTSKRTFKDSVRMDSVAHMDAEEFFTSSTQNSEIFDKVVALVTDANSKCKRSPAFSVPQSPNSKYLKTLARQIQLLKAGKFVSNYDNWMDWWDQPNFPGKVLKGVEDLEVWEMIEFAVAKYIRVRDSDKYLFYGNRTAKINLSEFMFYSHQDTQNPDSPVRAQDGYSRFWQYLLPLTKPQATTSGFEEQLKKLYKKSSSVLGREVYNDYGTLEMSEKIRFCKSLIAIGNYYNKHKVNLLKNNAEGHLVIPNLSKVLKFYTKWIKRSGFEHVPNVYPENPGRWDDFVNFLKKNYGVDLEAIKKPKAAKKKTVYVEPEISEDEAYERSILGALYDVLDPAERLHKLKLWFRSQREQGV